MKTLTYNIATGLLTGAGTRPTDGEATIEVTDEEYAGWTGLRMTADLTGTEPYTPPPARPPVPDEVRMEYAQIALNEAGLLPQVEAAIDALPEPQKTNARITWNRAPTVRRYSAMTQLLGQAAGITSEQIDALFIRAGAIAAESL